MTLPVSFFPNGAIYYLAQMLAKNGADKIPAAYVGGLLWHMTGWEKVELQFLMEFVREPLPLPIWTDVEGLLDYVPSRPFRSRDEVVKWFSRFDEITRAVDIAREWGYCFSRKKPSAAVQWNAFLIKGLAILGRSDNGLIERDSVFHAMRCLGCSRSEALQAIEAAKASCAEAPEYPPFPDDFEAS